MQAIRYTGIAKKWFDKVNGNTYHSVRITRNKDNSVVKAKAYGYDNQYKYTGILAMDKAGWNLKGIKGVNDSAIAWHDMGYVLKRDMIAWSE